MLFEHRYAGSYRDRAGRPVDRDVVLARHPARADVLPRPAREAGRVPRGDQRAARRRDLRPALHPEGSHRVLRVARAAELRRSRDRSRRQQKKLADEIRDAAGRARRSSSRLVARRRQPFYNGAPEVLRLPLPARQGAVVQARSGHHRPPGPGVLRVLLAGRVELRPARRELRGVRRSSATARAARRTSTTRETLYDEFQKIRSYKTTTLDVDPAGFDVQDLDARTSYREVKIDLPDSWVRGFLQVSAAATLPAHVVELHPMDVHNLCFVLRRHKELFGPRSLRFKLTPGAPVAVVVDPWGTQVECPRSMRDDRPPRPRSGCGAAGGCSSSSGCCRVAKRVRLFLLGSGLPTFWVVDLGDLSFTLGLSGWTNNNWSEAGNFDLMARARGRRRHHPASACSPSSARPGSRRPRSSRSAPSLATPTVASRARRLGAGRSRDLRSRSRRLSQARADARSAADGEAAVLERARARGRARCSTAGRSRSIASTRPTAVSRSRAASATRGKHASRVSLTFDADRRLVRGECSCDFFIRNQAAPRARASTCSRCAQRTAAASTTRSASRRPRFRRTADRAAVIHARAIATQVRETFQAAFRKSIMRAARAAQRGPHRRFARRARAHRDARAARQRRVGARSRGDRRVAARRRRARGDAAAAADRALA